jgi:hypothetical protein
LALKGLPIYTNLCERRSDGQSSQCPYFAGCEYIQTRKAAYGAPFVILVHAHLGLEWGATAAERFYEEGDEDDGPERQRHFNPKQANILICDEDPTASLVEDAKLSPEDIRGLGEDGLGEKILAGLVHPGGLLNYLRDQGVLADRLREAAEDARTTKRNRGQISNPDIGDGEHGPSSPICTAVGSGLAGIGAARRGTGLRAFGGGLFPIEGRGRADCPGTAALGLQ